MSGHSKWATIKHKKGAADKARGKLFAKLIRQVEVAAREGGGDPDANPTLRTMFQKAREASVPLDTIERAIKRGTGELEGVRYEQVAYEGYAPSGVAVIVECLTDNRNRTGADIRSIFSKNGGSMAEPGSVSWQFERKGVIVVPKQGAVDSEDDLMLVALDAGAEDITDAGDHWQVTTPPSDLPAVRTALEEAGVAVRLGGGHHAADHDGAARQRVGRQEGSCTSSTCSRSTTTCRTSTPTSTSPTPFSSSSRPERERRRRWRRPRSGSGDRRGAAARAASGPVTRPRIFAWRAPAAAPIACTTTGASRWCWSSTRPITRRFAPSSCGRTQRTSTSSKPWVPPSSA